MGRPLRIEYPGALYHITSRGNEKRNIFLDDADRTKFLEMLSEYHERYGILIHSYVLMDNHYHLILETPRGNLLKVMHGINGGYTGYFNRKYDRSGHLFQGRYKGILVEKDAYLVNLSRYVHLNPVRAGIVGRPEQFKWSSYPGYIGKAIEHDWVEYSWVLSRFGNNTSVAIKRYRDYTEDALDREGDDPTRDLHSQVILGGEEFTDKIRGMLKGKALSHEIAERKRLTENQLPTRVIRTVAEAFGINEDTVRAKGKRDQTARKAAIYFMQRYAGLNNEKIGELFGGVHYSAVSKACARLRQEMASNRKLAELIGELDSQFKI